MSIDIDVNVLLDDDEMHTLFYYAKWTLLEKNMDIRHYDVDEMHVFGTNRTKVHYFTCKLLQYNSHSRVSLWRDIIY